MYISFTWLVISDVPGLRVVIPLVPTQNTLLYLQARGEVDNARNNHIATKCNALTSPSTSVLLCSIEKHLRFLPTPLHLTI